MKNLLKYLSAILALTALTTASAKTDDAISDDKASGHSGRESFYFEALAGMGGAGSRNTITGPAVTAGTLLDAYTQAPRSGQVEVGRTLGSFRLGLNFSYSHAYAESVRVTTVTPAEISNVMHTVGYPNYYREYLSCMVKGYYDLALCEKLDAFVGLGLGVTSARVGAIELADYGVSTGYFSKTLFTWGLDVGLAWHVAKRVDLVAKYAFQYIPGFDIKGVDASFDRSLLNSICLGVRFHL